MSTINSAAATAKSKPYFKIVLLVMLVFFVISFITNVLNSIIVDVKDSFHLSLTETGFLPFSFFIAYAIMSVPAGILSEKYGNKTLLGVSFALMTAASFLFVIFPSYLIFSLTLFVLGCCMAVLQVIINPMLRTAGGEENFAFNSVLAQLFFGAASFLSPFLYKYLVNDYQVQNTATWLRSFVPAHMNWASLYLVFSIISLGLLVVVMFVKYPSNNLVGEELSNKKFYLKLLSNKFTWLYFLAIFCYVGVEQGIGNWISQYLFEYHQIDPQKKGAEIVAYFWAMLTVGCFLGLVLLKIMDSRKVLIGATIASACCLFTALTSPVEIALFAFPLVGFFISVMWSIIISLALNSISTHHAALSGILCTGIAGGAIMPLIVGVLASFVTLEWALYFLFLPLAFIMSIGFWAKPLVSNKILGATSNH